MARTPFELLPEFSCVFFHSGGFLHRLVRTLGGTTRLNAIPWAVVQVWGDTRNSSACRPLWPPAAHGRPSARNPTRVGCSYLLSLCTLLYEHYSFAIWLDCEELLLPPPLASLSQLTRAAEQVCGEAKRKDKGIRRICGGTLGRRIICRIYGRLVPFPWFQVHGRIHFFVRSW